MHQGARQIDLISVGEIPAEVCASPVFAFRVWLQLGPKFSGRDRRFGIDRQPDSWRVRLEPIERSLSAEQTECLLFYRLLSAILARSHHSSAPKSGSVSFTFNPFDGFDEIEDPLFGEIRQEYRGNESNFHFVYRIKNEFYCQSCWWVSSNDPNRSEDPIGNLELQHIEGERIRNLTLEEEEQINSRMQFSSSSVE